MIDLRNVSLLDILPESLKSDPDFYAMAVAISPEIREISAAIDEVLFYANLDNLPEPLVDLLAWQKRVDFYDASLPLEKKRQLVRLSDEFKRRKGTAWAVDQVVSAAFDDSEVSEWFEYGGQPYHFKVTTKGAIPNEATLHALFRAIDAVKRKSTRLESVSIERESRLNLYVGTAFSRIKITTIKPEAI